jgi:acetyltransferase-like isoleucine patch superfamily enzyme
MFNYENMTEQKVIQKIKQLPIKLIRWLVINHPDNKVRKLCLRQTNVVVGNNSVININFIVSDNYKPLLKIGKRVAISPNVTIICASGPNNSYLKYNKELYKQNIITESEVIIENDVWIGANVTILPGVRIGKESIIGAGSVVTKSMKKYSVIYGVPAKSVKKMKKTCYEK